MEEDGVEGGMPAMKRKKTVTWADGEDSEQDADMNEDSERLVAIVALEHPPSSDGPVVVLRGGDPIFATLDVQALATNHRTTEMVRDGPLTKEQLTDRRVGRCDRLCEAYESEFWALADELLLRRWTLEAEQPDSVPNMPRECKFANVKQDPAVVAAIAEGGGVQAVWSIVAAASLPGTHTLLPAFDELEVLLTCLPSPENEGQIKALQKRVVSSREAFLRQLGRIGRLEASATALTSRELDSYGAIAALTSNSTRYLLRRTAITIGRGKESHVDVDLAIEGSDASLVSRQQAQLFLDTDDRWKIRCQGRRQMSVNDQLLKEGQVAEVHHLSLIRIGPLALLFFLNRGASARLSRRSAALTIS